MQKAIKSMKNNKCRDAFGIINELFKPVVAGKGFMVSLLSLLNKTKDLNEIPQMMKNVNIALIPKPGKRKLKGIYNHRGIFLIPKYRSLLMRMLLNDNYDIIDDYMSDSNVGGRKNRSIRDHLFIVNGILHEHSKSKTIPISIQILDYKNSFDSLWQDDITNERYDAGVHDDKLALLHSINKINFIRVKTPAGISDVKTVKNNICQGDPWGSIQCGVMVDNFGKDSLAEELEPYKYKGKVPVPLLGMVDDVLSISDCGYKTRRMNAFLNEKTAVKRLQFGLDKCHVMHVGKNIPEYKKDTLYVDGWEMKEIQNKSTGEVEVQETLQGNSIISESINEKYLGQIISSDASNVANVTSRTSKGTGMTHTIESIMKNVPRGRFNFEIAVILRNAYLISSMLSCSEVWYNVNEHQLRKLEQVDEKLLRIILNCSSQVTHETLYLELGRMPIRFIIKLRRIIYLTNPV